MDSRNRGPAAPFGPVARAGNIYLQDLGRVRLRPGPPEAGDCGPHRQGHLLLGGRPQVQAGGGLNPGKVCGCQAPPGKFGPDRPDPPAAGHQADLSGRQPPDGVKGVLVVVAHGGHYHVQPVGGPEPRKASQPLASLAQGPGHRRFPKYQKLRLPEPRFDGDLRLPLTGAAHRGGDHPFVFGRAPGPKALGRPVRITSAASRTTRLGAWPLPTQP